MIGRIDITFHLQWTRIMRAIKRIINIVTFNMLELVPFECFGLAFNFHASLVMLLASVAVVNAVFLVLDYVIHDEKHHGALHSVWIFFNYVM